MGPDGWHCCCIKLWQRIQHAKILGSRIRQAALPGLAWGATCAWLRLTCCSRILPTWRQIWSRLESEGLVFTINSLGSADGPIQALHSGRMPGSHELPLLRQVVRKEYVGDELSLDLETWLAGMQGIPAMAGKLIIHTTEGEERQPLFPARRPDWKGRGAIAGANTLGRAPALIYPGMYPSPLFQWTWYSQNPCAVKPAHSNHGHAISGSWRR